MWALPVAVMAGGEGRRMGPGAGEKPLLRLGGRTLLERTVSALQASGLEEIVVAVSPRTPGTAELARRLGLAVLPTLGAGYVEDVRRMLDRYPRLATVSSDLPFLDPRTLAQLWEGMAPGGDWVAVVPQDRCLPGFSEGVPWNGPDPSLPSPRIVGINAVDRRSVAGPERALPVLDPWISANVNTVDDLRRAQELLPRWETRASETGLARP